MANEPVNPVSTTSKVNAYVINLIESLKKDALILTLKDKVDICGLLDNIRKRTEEYIKTIKPELPLDNMHKEIIGTICKVTYNEKNILEVTPEALEKELNHDDFIRAVKMNLTNAKTFVSEDRLKEIGITIIQPNVSFKMR